MRSIVAIIAISLAGTALAEDTPLKNERLTTTIDRGLAFLAKDSLAWKEKHNCASCHHASLVVWALREGKERGHSVDEKVMVDMSKWMMEAGEARVGVARPASVPRALNTKPIYFSLGLGSDPKPDEATRKSLKLMQKTIKSDQLDNGSLAAWPETRAPLFGNSDESMTALAILAVLPEAATDDEAKAIRDKGMKWLADTKSDNDPQSIALRLILWTKLVRPAKEWEPLVKNIKDRQNADGGWSQTKEMQSDAWATGQALYALANAGIKAEDPAIARAHAFLIKTQREDGSWIMTSRPTKPGAEGAKNLMPIIGAGSAWAVLGLVRSRQ